LAQVFKANLDKSTFGQDLLKSQNLEWSINVKNYLIFESISEGDIKMPIKSSKKISYKPKTAIDPSVVSQRIKTKLVKARLTDENYALYYRYSSIIHKREDDAEKWNDWLCVQNLQYELSDSGLNLKLRDLDDLTPKDDDSTFAWGSWHLEWYLDGEFIALSVLDICPASVYSQYFLYDPKFRPLQIGIVSAMHELEWVKNLSAKIPTMKWYWLGWYTPIMQNMRYKKDFTQQEIMCPGTMRYVPFTQEIVDQIDTG
jgi:arginine-tRNA-protein transferase